VSHVEFPQVFLVVSPEEYLNVATELLHYSQTAKDQDQQLRQNGTENNSISLLFMLMMLVYGNKTYKDYKEKHKTLVRKLV
jgi:hypothetical protein